MNNKKYTFIDLFAGAGGLSEGFISQGDFLPVSHIEMNKSASETLITRLAYHYLNENNQIDRYNDYLENKITKGDLISLIPNSLLGTVINEEIKEENLYAIFKKIDYNLKKLKKRSVDVIIGGPPCQGFSLIGRATNNYSNRIDPRNQLYLYYIEFLIKYQPKMFIFENVPGILSHNNKLTFRKICDAFKKVGYNTDYKVLNAKDFGVLQNRKRVIIVGWREDTNYEYPDFDTSDSCIGTINELFYDLPKIVAGQKSCEYRFDANQKLINSKIRNDRDILTWHESRNHNDRDLEIYRLTIQKWNKESKRLKYNELPRKLINHNNHKSFLDRFKVVAGNLPFSHTITAHVAKDGHHYIHPDINQARSLTVREVARIQSFPDNYYFEGSRTAAYTQIGNAVPPKMAQKLAEKLSIDLSKFN